MSCDSITAAPCAHAQNYPAKPIRIIAAQSAGGGTDLFARLLGQKISENWKQARGDAESASTV